MSSSIPILGYGTMSMTTKSDAPPRSESVKLLKYMNSKYSVNLISGSIFYSRPGRDNLQLLADACNEIPDLILIIKDAITSTGPDGRKETIDNGIANISKYFADVKYKPKLYVGPARIDKKVSLEETFGALKYHVDQGTIDGVFLSEVGAETIKKVSKITTVHFLELEFSMMTQDNIHNGVFEVASELNIPIACYSPVGRGLLTDQAVETPNFLESLPKDDPRFGFNLDRFKPEYFDQNIKCIRDMYDFAHNKLGVTLEVLALSYIKAVSEKSEFKGIKPPKLIAIPSGRTEARIDSNYGNLIDIKDEDFEELQKMLDSMVVVGSRYNKMMEEKGMVSS